MVTEVNVRHKEETRVFQIENEKSFHELENHIENILKITHFNICYKDEDGDDITIKTDEELQVYLDSIGQGKIKFFIKEMKSSNQQSYIDMSIKNISNIFDLLNKSFNLNKQLATQQLFEELENNIHKNKIIVENHFEQCQLDVEKQKQNNKTNENNLNNHMKKVDELFNELTKLQQQTPFLQKSVEESKLNLIKSENEFNQSKLVFEESKKIIKKINEMNQKNSTFIQKWNQNISQGNIDSFNKDDELIIGLLDFCNLDDWFNQFKTKILSSSNTKICDIRPYHLIALRKNEEKLLQLSNNQRKMSFGEAKYFCIIVEEIQKNKKLPKIMNDIDLNEKNMKSWTIQNVFNYFKNIKNMNEVAKVLFESKINGIVLLNLNESEIQHLGIENIQEINSFINLLKQLQKNDNHSNQNKQNKSTLIIPGPSALPEDLTCPLSNKLMIDPVLAQDGNTYERKAIQEWFKNGNNTSPLTGEEIEIFLIPNNTVRKQCEKWRKENGTI